MTDAATTPEEEAINLTIGRVTNEQMEATTEIWFKHEMESGLVAHGPIYLKVEGEDNLVPLNKGEAEWYSENTARALASALGVEVVWS